MQLILIKIVSNSRNTEVDDVVQRMLSIYKKNDWSFDTTLTTMFSKVEEKSKNLSSAIMRSIVKSEQKVKNEARNSSLRDLNYSLVGYVSNPDPIIKAAATTVKTIFDKYGLAITTESYAIESSHIHSLLTELGDEEAQTAMGKLSGCISLYSTLLAKQEDFTTTYANYEERLAEAKTKENATLIKKDLLSTINDTLVIYLRSMYIVENEVYGSLIRTINQIISDNNETVKRRLSNNIEEIELQE